MIGADDKNEEIYSKTVHVFQINSM